MTNEENVQLEVTVPSFDRVLFRKVLDVFAQREVVGHPTGQLFLLMNDVMKLVEAEREEARIAEHARVEGFFTDVLSMTKTGRAALEEMI